MTRIGNALFFVAVLTHYSAAYAQAPCPAARDLPQLTIDDLRAPWLPLYDNWQILFGDTPVSDAQLANFARDEMLQDAISAEMHNRPSRTYLGMGVTAAGTALSLVGAVLYGQNNLSNSITIPLAVGGLAVGITGLVLTTTAIQTPLEPYLAPTPKHRMTRDEARRIVAKVNERWHQDICKAAASTTP